MTAEKFPQVVVLGMGTWGAGLAHVLAHRHERLHCWDRDAAAVDRLIATRRHPRLGDAELPASLARLERLDAASIAPDALLVVVVPSIGVRPVLEGLRAGGVGSRAETFVLACKGLEPGTNLTMPEVVPDVLGAPAGTRTALLSGPSHAEEVILGSPTTVVAAADDAALAARVQATFMTPRFRVYTQDDVRGVALGGSLKNIYAIGAGAAVGLGYGDNTLAALMTRAIAELSRLGVALGARPDTFAGLAGLGDLIVTCMSRHSRNRRFGELRAAGRTREQALADIGMAVEGVHTCQCGYDLARREGVEMPIVEEIHALIYENKPAQRAVADLMTREAKSEDTLARSAE